MKLRDLARTSRSSTSIMPVFYIFRSRFGNQETARRSRKTYEFVPGLSSPLRLFTLLQQSTMVPVLGILYHPRHPGFPVTFPIWSYHGDRYIRKRTCSRPTSFLDFLIFEQNQNKVYREVLIAGDLSEENASQADSLGYLLLSGTTASDIVEFVHGNETVYFAQPSSSQFVPGGAGAGTFDPPAKMGLKNTPTPVLAGRNAPKNTTGAVLRCVPPVH